MKRIILSLAVFLFASAAWGQVQVIPGVVNVTTAPTGACPQGAPGQKDATGNITTCQGPFVAGVGTWTGAAVANFPGVSSNGANGLTITGTPASTTDAATVGSLGTFSAPLGGNFYAANYGVKFDVKAKINCTSTNTSTTITCASGTFSASDVGKIEFGTTDASNGNLIVPQGTITAFNSTSSVTVSLAATGSAGGTLVFLWGHDDTSALSTAWTASSTVCGQLILPAGMGFVQSAEFITLPNALCSSSGSPYLSAGWYGTSISQSWLIPTPSFNFATCTGGTSAHACFGGTPSSRYHDFSIWGGGYNLSGQNLSGAVFLELAQSTGLNQVDIVGWGQGSTNSTCILDQSTQSGLYQGGNQNCANIGLHVTSSANPASIIGWFVGPTTGTPLLIDSGAVLDGYNVTYGGNLTVNGTLNSYGDWFGTGVTVTGTGVCNAWGSYAQGTILPPAGCLSNAITIAGSILYSDAFSYSNGALPDPWVTSTAGARTNCAVQVVSSGHVGATSSASPQLCASYYNAAISADQYSQATFTTGTSTQTGVGVFVRQSAAADTRYDVNWSTINSIYLEKIVAGVVTVFGGWPKAHTLVNGDVVRIDATGSTITVKINGSVFGSAVDSSIAAGFPGVWTYTTNNTGTYPNISTWSAGTTGVLHCLLLAGTGAPNGLVTGNVCDTYQRADGGANTTFYVKESGSATNTGWVAK